MFLAYYLQSPHWRQKTISEPIALAKRSQAAELASIVKETEELSERNVNTREDANERIKQAIDIIERTNKLAVDNQLETSGQRALYVRAELEQVCDNIALHDWEDMDNPPTDEIALLRKLSSETLNAAETASCLTFLMKVAIIKIGESGGTKEEISELYAEIISHLSDCWDSYLSVFKVLPIYKMENMDVIPKFISRFIHFIRVYYEVAELTEKNQIHSETIAAYIYGAMLKQAAILPPHLLGRYYPTQKMAREILNVMHQKFPHSKALYEYSYRSIMVSREYLSATRIDPNRLGLANFLLSPRQRLLDEMLEKLGPEQDMNSKIDPFSQPVDAMQGELMEEICQCSGYNDFGSHGDNPSFLESNILHLHYVVHNEVNYGLYLYIFFNGRMLTRLITLDFSLVVSQIEKSLQESITNQQSAIESWSMLATILDLASLPEILEELGAIQLDIERIYIYPDAHLVNVPWKAMISKHAGLGSTTDIGIAVKVSSKTTDSSMNANAAIVAAASTYGHTNLHQPNRRGSYRDGIFLDLPSVRTEGLKISQIIRESGMEVFRADNCSAREFLKMPEKNDARKMVHLACHGMAAKDGKPIIWLPQDTDNDDSKYTAVHAERMLRVDWQHCEFVFINACFGGASAPFVGGAPLGFSEPLSASGVKIILAPIWPVDDDIACFFAVEYYEQLNRTKDYFLAYNSAYDIVCSKFKNAELTVSAYTLVIL